MDIITTSIKDFEEPQAQFLQIHEAVAYLVHLLLKDGTFYTSGAIAALNKTCEGFQLGETIANKAVVALKNDGLIAGEELKLAERGRPRIMYSLTEKGKNHPRMGELAEHWMSGIVNAKSEV